MNYALVLLFQKKKITDLLYMQQLKKQNSIFQTHYNSIHNKLEGQLIHTRL